MDAFDTIQSAELSSKPSYASHPDIALAVIETAEYTKGKFGQVEDAEMYNLTFRLLTSATQNTPKSAESAGDIIKYKAVLPHPQFSESANPVKASIFKRLCESAEATNYANYKANRNTLCTDLLNKQVKIVIILEEAFVVDKEHGNEPLIKNFTRVSIIEHSNKSINKSLNEIQKVIPLKGKQLKKYQDARAYWEQNNPTQPQQKDDFLDAPKEKDAFDDLF